MAPTETTTQLLETIGVIAEAIEVINDAAMPTEQAFADLVADLRDPVSTAFFAARTAFYEAQDAGQADAGLGSLWHEVLAAFGRFGAVAALPIFPLVRLG